MPRLADPRDGALLRNQPNGIPLFFERRAPRIVTADPWAFFRNAANEHLSKLNQARAVAYINQAYDFFRAAENPQVGSKPLLYYYCFLNLAKVLVLIWGVPIPLRVMHGIEDPRANIKQRIRVVGQQVRLRKRSTSYNQMWAEFVRILGVSTSSERTVKLVDVLSQVPTVHRTFTRVTRNRTRLLPIDRIEAFNNAGQVWLRLALKRHDRDVDLTLPAFRRRADFQAALHQVSSPPDERGATREIWLETNPEPGTRRGIDTAIGRLAEVLFELPCTAILTGGGYRFYFSDVASSDWLHPAAAIYAAMFYLGSVTRYKPDVFGKLLGGGYAWVVEEFIATAPMQFIYIVAGVLAGCEVVRPHAAIR